MKIFLRIAAVCCLLTPLTASAEPGRVGARKPLSCAAGQAKLVSADGKALISRGGSFSEIGDGATLAAGDRVLMREGSGSVVVGAKVLTSADAGGLMMVSSKDGLICAAKSTTNPAVVGQEQSSEDYCRLHSDDQLRCGGAALPFGVSPLWGLIGVAAVGGGVGGGVAASSGGGGANAQNQRLFALFLLANVSHH